MKLGYNSLLKRKNKMNKDMETWRLKEIENTKYDINYYENKIKEKKFKLKSLGFKE